MFHIDSKYFNLVYEVLNSLTMKMVDKCTASILKNQPLGDKNCVCGQSGHLI